MLARLLNAVAKVFEVVFDRGGYLSRRKKLNDAPVKRTNNRGHQKMARRYGWNLKNVYINRATKVVAVTSCFVLRSC